MKTESKIIIFLTIGLVLILGVGNSIEINLKEGKNEIIKSKIVLDGKEENKKKEDAKKVNQKIEKQIENKEEITKIEETKEEMDSTPTSLPELIVYDGLTMNQLSDKLNRSLKSTISGTGYTFASKSLELGIDPYLALAIVLHETGCNGDCSYLVKACNNVGGMKGSPGCNGGSYAEFATLEEGIEAYLNNLYKNYYAYGLTTPETIGPKYAASSEWPSKVRWYINSIRSK